MSSHCCRAALKTDSAASSLLSLRRTGTVLINKPIISSAPATVDLRHLRVAPKTISCSPEWRWTDSYVTLSQFSISLEHFSQKPRKAAIQQCVVKRPEESERCLTPLKESKTQHRCAV